MKDLGIRINLWTNPYVSAESPMYKQMLPYVGTHTVWGGVVPDYTIPKAQSILLEQLNNDQVKLGVSGYKIDECDGYDRLFFTNGHD